MRLEISTGGLDGFFNGISNFADEVSNTYNTNRLIDTIQKISNETNDISGDLGALTHAIDYMNNRKRIEESRKIAIDNVKRDTKNFIDTTVRIDKSVAIQVNISTEEFYKTNPWLRPPEEKGIFERIWDNTGGAVIDAWDGVIKFYLEHKVIINKFVVGLCAIGLATLVTFLTGGAMAPFLMGTAIFVGTSTLVGGTISFITKGLFTDEGFTLENFIEGAADVF